MIAKLSKPVFSLAFHALILITFPLCAQTTTNERWLFVKVTDPNHRFVVGLEQKHFEIVQSGVRRPITSFSAVDEPMTIAVVLDSPLAGLSLNAGDQLIQTASAADAIRQLMASKDSRKVLIMASTSNHMKGFSIPGGILAVTARSAEVERSVIELRNQYRIGFATEIGAEDAQLILAQPDRLPVLKASCFIGCFPK